MADQQHPITPPPELMTDTTRNLIIKLSSHMAYMQGQLEAHHELDDLEDYYWYRESVALRQQVADALAADEPAVPEGGEPASVVGEPSDRELLEEGPSLEDVEELCEEHCFNVEGYESIECLQGLINEAISRWGHQPAPPAEGEVAELVAWLRRHASAQEAAGTHWAGQLTRAADLLAQRHPAPVPSLATMNR